jgi:hypothetical protein
MRTTFVLTLGLVLAVVCLRAPWVERARAEEDSHARIGNQFRDMVRPFLTTYCLDCHSGKKPKAELNLGAYGTFQSVTQDLEQWEVVLEQLETKTMPPAEAKRQPPPEARRNMIAWIRAVRQREAERGAGDPGPVAARRLSNAEYDNTIRDLTGIDIRPTREFPVDPANAAGFDNSSESLAMSPALVKKLLGAARLVADNIVFKPQGFDFAPFPVVADTDRDKYCVRRIIEFYKKQRTDYADYFEAAWRYQYRAALGRPSMTLADAARTSGVSAKYLERVWSILNEPAGEDGPIAALLAMWHELPPPGEEDNAQILGRCETMRDFVVELRGRLTPEVKNLTLRGMNNGSQPLVLWKNRQFVANRMRYAGTAAQLQAEPLTTGTLTARRLAVPAEIGDAEAAFTEFCATFPDTFVVSERARVYLDPKKEKDLTGRLLSAGFHNMMGYFRDDGPLYELILDEAGQRALDRLWQEFDFITGAPLRQYSGFLWFERAESRYLRDTEFDFVRAENKDAASDSGIRKLSELYLAKARRLGASGTVLDAIQTYFKGISANLRWVERAHVAAEPSHVESLLKFTERAYRRPLPAEDKARVAGFYRALRDEKGLSHQDAIRDTVVSVLMSPHFCYRVDLPSEGSGVRPLSDYALASRLSYFLWSSMPDEELLARAAAGELQRPEVLVAQARRMLQDDRVRGLATEFCGNWLDCRRFEEHNSVDRRRFPTFDDELRRSMFEEPLQFFLDVVRRDRPVSEFLDGNYTFVNRALARHYGMPEPKGGPDTWVRVDDASRYGRGGLLTMAVFLTKNSPGLRTSPVKRGYWVVRRLLGETIPAPPPNVPELPNDESKLGELTLRETLARHRADKACAGCHERFDAMGLAFEGYGPVGEARLNDLAGRPVDTRVTYPGGSQGTGIEGLRSYLDTSRRQDFLDNLCRKLLVYALGRSLIPSDDSTIARMRERLASDGNRFGSLVESIVTSPQFRNKRVEVAAKD